MQPGWRVENRRELFSFLARFAHTLGSAAPHNYINGTSLRTLILPLTQLGLGALVPSSPRFGAWLVTHVPLPLPEEMLLK